MKQTLFSRFLAVSTRCYRSWLQNWFSYTLLLIVLLAIWKKHQNQVRQLLGNKQVQESGFIASAQKEDLLTNLAPEQTRRFIARFERTARQEEKKFGIPARIILAVALVQSDAGTNQAAISKHNYFALRTGSGLAHYQSAWESFRAFSLVVNQALAKQERPKTDQEWIAFLQKSKCLDTSPQFEQLVKQALP